jgi:ankyrin repeat protein
MQVELLHAIYQNDLSKIKTLLDPLSVNNPLTTCLKTALHFAVRTNNKELVRYLVKELNANVDSIDINGWTPLGLITVEGNDEKYDLAQYLIHLGADVDISSRSSNYYSPFEMSRDARDKAPEIFKLLKIFTKNKHWEGKKGLLISFEREFLKLV